MCNLKSLSLSGIEKNNSTKTKSVFDDGQAGIQIIPNFNGSCKLACNGPGARMQALVEHFLQEISIGIFRGQSTSKEGVLMLVATLMISLGSGTPRVMFLLEIPA